MGGVGGGGLVYLEFFSSKNESNEEET